MERRWVTRTAPTRSPKHESVFKGLHRSGAGRTNSKSRYYLDERNRGNRPLPLVATMAFQAPTRTRHGFYHRAVGEFCAIVLWQGAQERVPPVDCEVSRKVGPTTGYLDIAVVALGRRSTP